MAFPAGFPKLAAMDVKVARGAKKGFIENRVVHFRDAGFEHTMLLVAEQAFCVGFMKAKHPPERHNIVEIVAIQTLFLGDSFPGDVTARAIMHLLVRGAERPGSGRLFIGEQPS